MLEVGLATVRHLRIIVMSGWIYLVAFHITQDLSPAIVGIVLCCICGNTIEDFLDNFTIAIGSCAFLKFLKLNPVIGIFTLPKEIDAQELGSVGYIEDEFNVKLFGFSLYDLGSMDGGIIAEYR